MEIFSASEADMPEIQRLAKSLDLDCEDFSWHQFVVAKNNTIIGFGRLRTYSGCIELATIGVIPEARNKGVAGAVVKELIQRGPDKIFLTCVIPDFFSKFGFKIVKEYPSVLKKKIDFCKSYNYKEEDVFVMQLIK